ncbi:WGR domain-containing protein [Asticcacaulis sp. YBE204]|uniref:WGR domain-containing protein n=1 Tax=Asticcacaulis sp. YBE204 TaxID=1282363 RepID=UPI0003C3E4EE|nr:WGR domain-containing protein [Asticcacaulis sp. YBE204]ESQ79439.1 hypothetical protein AEYBE204_10555 [Asticcacaulis sp. YBE204]
MSVSVLRRIDHSQNMARAYELSIQPGLFGDVSIVRHWGRIGTAGQTKEFWFDTEAEAQKMQDDVLRQKQRRGYELITAFADHRSED